MWRHGKIMYHVMADVYFMNRWPVLMLAEYAVMECFADPKCFPKKFLERAELLSNYKRISPHALMAWVHFRFSGVGTFEVRFEPYQLRSNFRLCDSGSG